MMFPPELLDRDALGIVRELQYADHVAYFVGGCVRDLLLAVLPKDFDIVTDATPSQLKRLFGRRCRMIGRRFRLAHVRNGAQIFEVATFRGSPEEQETDEDSDFVVRANTFGTPEEDARSRDFTINGLFYDPIADHIIDHVGGREDVERRRVRTIGDAFQRFREDPVRLLRAVKFASRLDLKLDDSIERVASEAAPLISSCPAARVSEEMYRIAESGHAQDAFALLDRLSILEALIDDDDFHLGEVRVGLDAWLGQLDRFTRAHGTLPRESVFALVLWPLLWHEVQQLEEPGRIDWAEIASDLMAPLIADWNIPVRHRQRLRGVARVLRRAMYPPSNHRYERSLFRSPALPLALSMLRANQLLGADHRELYDDWSRRACDWPTPFERPAPGNDTDPRPRRGGRPPSKRRRRDRGPRRGRSEG